MFFKQLTADSKRCLSPNLPRSASADNVLQEKQRSRTFNSCPPTPEFQSNTKFVIPENEAESIKSEPIPESGAVKEDAVVNDQFQKKMPLARQTSWRQVRP